MALEPTRIFWENKSSSARIYLNRGGTRSSKTYSLIQLAVVWLLAGKHGHEKQAWSVCRATLPALRASALRDFNEIMDTLGAWPRVRTNLSNYEYTCGNRTVEFFSLDNQQKIRSRKRLHLHICEANEISEATFLQLTIRTRGKIFLDWNPDDPYHWIREKLEEERAAIKGDVKVIVSTYKDNPHLTQQEVQEIEYLKVIDPEMWAVFGTGEYGTLTDLIFKNYIKEEYPEYCDYEYYGIDFGFHPDPAAVIRVGKSGNNIYLKEEIYKGSLTNPMLGSHIRSAGISHLQGVADSAEPKSIVELNAEGLQVWKAVKGPDSIRAGINFMRSYRLHVDPGSLNLLKEFRAYKWNDEKAGVPIDMWNHGIDAARYVISRHFRRTGGFTSR